LPRYLSAIQGQIYFPPASAQCPRCVGVFRGFVENQVKLDLINFDEYPPPIKGDPAELVADWSARLAPKFDQRGHIVPVTSGNAE
jgi:hypothetical protein